MDYRAVLDLKNKRAEQLDNAKTALGKKDMEGYRAALEDAKKMGEEIEAALDLIAETGRFGDKDTGMVTRNQALFAQKEEALQAKAANEVRGGNEYAQAWAYALRNGVHAKGGLGDTKLTPLYNALTISGGDPSGSDGGFLAPIDFDGQIIRRLKDYTRLADLCRAENVTAPSGWRVIEAAKTRKSLIAMDEAEPISADDQPKFEKINYSIKKYGSFLHVSDELMSDNIANLMAYLAEWFAPKIVLTENDLITKIMSKLTTDTIKAGEEIKSLKSVLNKALNTAYSRNAVILTNQDGYNHLDNLEDKNGRGLLVPDPTQPDVYRFKNRRVIVVDNTLLPTREVADAGATKGDYYPMFVGDLQHVATLFRRQALEFSSTNIGAGSWERGTTSIRGITRMDVQPVDSDAAVKREIFIPAKA